MSRGSSTGFDRHITIFSPEGRLFQVEYAFKAAKAPGLNSIGVRGADSVVLVAQKKVPDKLLDPSSVSNMFKVTRAIGSTRDHKRYARSQIQRCRHEAAQFEYENGFPIPVEFLAHRTANVAQIYTQHAFMRALGVITIFGGIDEEKGPALYRVDPVKANPKMSFAETMETAILALQTVVGADLKVLTVAQIDEHLTRISDRD